jgi:hypothetical protein
MSYTEYLRRKAASAPKIVDTTIRTDASTITMRRRLAANNEFAIGARQGVINNIADPSQTGTTSNLKAAQMTTKVSGGRIPDASLFTSFLGGQALDKDGGPFVKPQRYTLNSNSSESLSGCSIVDEPAPALPNGTLIGTISLNLTSLSASGTTLTVGFSPYTINTSQKQYRPGIGRNIVISGEFSTLSLTGFTNTAGVVTATTASTAGIQNGTVVTISGGTASAGNLGTFTVTSFVANTSITYTNASGVTEATTATATFVSPNNGTYAITSVVNATTVTVTNANAITDAVVNGTVLVPIVVSGKGSNAVPQNASLVALTAESCRYPSTEGHIQSELGPALFVDNTNTIKNYNLPQNKTTYQISQDCLQCGNNKTIGGTTCAFCIGANHTHPADVPHNTKWIPRPEHGRGGIPVSTVPSPSDARKVGDRNPRNIPYVEKHHGSGLTTSFPRVPRKYVIPGQPPAQLKINDPRHYPVS